MENLNYDFMLRWKKNSILIDAPTNLIATATTFIPILWLCSTYNCWPDWNIVLTAWGIPRSPSELSTWWNLFSRRPD